MKNKVLGMMLAVMMTASLVIGCSSGNSDDTSEESTATTSETPETIKIGGTSISQVSYDAIKELFEEKGYKTEFVCLDSNQVCLEACASGDVDMSLGQHKKYVESFDENNGADLTMAKPYAYYTGIGLYSEKYDSVDEFPDGAQIAVMNDAMNEDIALRILEEQGLIEIDASVDQATVADITSNPKNLEIIEMDQAQTVTQLEDMAGACVFFTHMSAAGKDPSTYIARDTAMINYPMGVIVREEDVESDWAVAFAECFKDENVQKEINDAFPGVFEFYTSDDQVEE